MASRAFTAFDDDVAGAAVATVDLPVALADTLLVAWTVTDSAVTGDVGAATVKPFSPTDEVAAGALLDIAIPATVVTATTRVGTEAVRLDRYDVRGLEKVRLSLTNGAVGTKNLVMHVFLDN